jgi:hypothetical protein
MTGPLIPTGTRVPTGTQITSGAPIPTGTRIPTGTLIPSGVAGVTAAGIGLRAAIAGANVTLLRAAVRPAGTSARIAFGGANATNVPVRRRTGLPAFTTGVKRTTVAVRVRLGA